MIPPQSALRQKLRDGAINGLNRIQDFIFRASPNDVLNVGGDSPPPDHPAEALRRSANRLMSIGLDGAGQVDYKKLANSSEYRHYRSVAASLQSYDPAQLTTKEDRMAFWINLYNALILDAVIQFQVKGSISASFWIFRRAAYKINGMRFSADEIEHGILRHNRRNPMLPLPPFASDDPRLAYAADSIDPRVHFALVCGARSCPPINVYQAEKLNQQLDLAAASFINRGGVRFDPESKSLCLSQIFRWYKDDFDGERGVVELVKQYLQDEQALQAIHTDQPRIKYSNYDWGLNGKPALTPS